VIQLTSILGFTCCFNKAIFEVYTYN